MNPILHIRKFRHREVKKIIEAHIASKCIDEAYRQTLGSVL